MTKRLEAKHKIDRRLGANIWGRPKSPLNKRDYRPGQHGQRRTKLSDYGVSCTPSRSCAAITATSANASSIAITKKPCVARATAAKF